MKVYYLVLTLMCLLLPVNTFAEAFVDNSNKENTPIVVGEHNIHNEEVIRHHNQVKKPDTKHESVHVVTNKNNTLRPKYNNNNYTNVVHYNRYVVRPIARPIVRAIIIPNSKDSLSKETSIEVTNSKVTSSSSYQTKFSLGLHGVVSLNSNLYDYEVSPNGGFGFYFKFRPLQRISLQIMNDYLFGSLKYSDDEISHSYFKIKASLGINVYLFSYNDFDLYTTLAVSLSWWNYDEIDNYSCDSISYSTGFQSGGSFGLGFSYMLNEFVEFGIEFDYTVETMPDFVPHYRENYEYNDSEIMHGLLFTLSIGFVL